MLPTTYQEFFTNEYHGDCPVCTEPMLGKPARAHPGDGQKHPVCYDCAVKIIDRNGKCPICRVPIRNEVSWKDRCIVELKEIGKDIGKGLGCGLFFLASAQVLITGLKVSSSEIMENPILEKTPLIPFLSSLMVMNIIGKEHPVPSLMGGLSAAFVGLALSSMMGGVAAIAVGVASGDFIRRNILKISNPI